MTWSNFSQRVVDLYFRVVWQPCIILQSSGTKFFLTSQA